MLNLKPYFDAAQAANAEVLRVANAIEGAFGQGTEEGTQEAMGMRQELDDAQAKAEAAGKLYESMKAASSTGDAAAKFVPVSTEQAATGKKTITRAEYENMSHPDRYNFLMKDGGMVVDELPAE